VLDDIQEHVQIIFTTNHLQTIYGALRSRCTILEIKPALAMDWLVRARFIMKNEGLVMDDQLLLKIIEDQLKCEHDHRKLLQLLEQVVWQCRNGIMF
jgi:DNA polymerase III delta prime subunit